MAIFSAHYSQPSGVGQTVCLYKHPLSRIQPFTFLSSRLSSLRSRTHRCTHTHTHMTEHTHIHTHTHTHSRQSMHTHACINTCTHAKNGIETIFVHLHSKEVHTNGTGKKKKRPKTLLMVISNLMCSRLVNLPKLELSGETILLTWFSRATSLSPVFPIQWQCEMWVHIFAVDLFRMNCIFVLQFQCVVLWKALSLSDEVVLRI